MQNLNCGRAKNTTKFWSRSVSKDALFETEYSRKNTFMGDAVVATRGIKLR